MDAGLFGRDAEGEEDASLVGDEEDGRHLPIRLLHLTDTSYHDGLDLEAIELAAESLFEPSLSPTPPPSALHGRTILSPDPRPAGKLRLLSSSPASSAESAASGLDALVIPPVDVSFELRDLDGDLGTPSPEHELFHSATIDANDPAMFRDEMPPLPSFDDSVQFCLNHIYLHRPRVFYALSLDHSANQRTFEAGVRTALALLALGLILARFNVVQFMPLFPLYLFHVSAVIVFAHSTYRYFRVTELMLHGHFEPNKFGISMLCILMLLLSIYFLVETSGIFPALDYI